MDINFPRTGTAEIGETRGSASRAAEGTVRASSAARVEPNRLREILGHLSEEVGPAQFERYFDGQTRLKLVGDELEVTVPTGFLAQLISRRFGEQLKKACEQSNARVNLSYRVDRDAFEDVRARPENPASGRSTRPAPSRTALVPGSKFTFETFVVGQANRLAHAAAVRLVEDAMTGTLFLHGVCGIGKSHLLYAIAHRFQQIHPRSNVRFTTAESFTNGFITAVRQGKVDAFRRLYRKVDLLCVDDVHFLSSKEATQTELLHTLEAAGLDGARLAFASDENPRDIKKISEKLVSRFLCGMVARIDTPELELRERLVKHLAQRRQLRIEVPAMKLIAERSMRSVGSLGGFCGSVRELEGLLIQVEAVHRLLPEYGSGQGNVGILLVRKAFGLQESDGPSSMLSKAARRPVAIESIMEEVCRELTVEFSELMGKGRHKRVVLARSMISYLARKLTTMSFPEIAKAMGRPNHSTIITAERRLAADLAPGKDAPLSAELAPNHSGLLLSELTRRISQQIQRGNQG